MGYFKLKIVFTAFLILLGFNIETSLGQQVPEIISLMEVNGDFQKINGVQQDNKGNLWVASDTHIERYNPHESQFYNKFQGLPEETGYINTLFIDSKDQVYIGAETGLLKFDPEQNSFVSIPSERPSTESNIHRITEDGSGNLWIGASNGIWNFSGEKINLITFFPTNQRVNQLIFADGHIVFGTSHGLFRMGQNSKNYKKIPLLSYKELNIQSLLYTGDSYFIGTREDGLFKTTNDFSGIEKIYTLPFSSQKFPVSGLAMDDYGNLYIATKGDGLLILDKNLNFVSQKTQEVGQRASLSDNNLIGLFLDETNTLWVSTESGQINSINLKEKNFQFIRHDPRKFASLADNFTTAIEEDSNGNVWFGTRQGLSIWTPGNDSWQHLKNLSFTEKSNIPDIIKDLHSDEIHMWVATYNDGVYKVNINTLLRAHYSPNAKNKIALQKVKTLLVDSNKNVWTGGEEGDLTQIKPNGEVKTFPLQAIDAMLELSSGDLIAGGKKGVVRIRRGGNQISGINKLNPNARNLPYFTVNSISETQSGEIILATEGAGIVIYYPSGDTYRTINKRSGMPSNRIQGLIIYEQDDIWAGTSNGLVNLKLEKDPVIRVFNKDDGLLSEVFTRGSYARLDNKLAFGTFKGVSVFDPQRLRGIPQTLPNVIIGSAEFISDKEEAVQLSSAGGIGKEIDLKYNQNSAKFNFYGLVPGHNIPIIYSWKLEGLENTWSNASSQTEVTYAHLAPGNYKFLVRAGTSNGNWGPVEEIAMNIQSPWWSSTAAYLIYAAMFLLVLIIPFYISGVLKRRRVKTARASLYKNLNQEIGTPLTIVLASLDNLAEDEGNKNNHRLKNLINRLKELLEPILNIHPEGFNRKNQKPRIKKLSIANYFDGLMKDLQPLMKQKGLEIIVNNQWNREYFYYDVDYLNKIFFNIISNSVKYSYQNGKIIINLIQTNKGDLKVQVADNGSGLPYEDQKIIREYYRNAKDGTAKENSNQINLLYVKDFIDKLGGSIVFESSKDEGTTFTLILKNHQKSQTTQEPQNEVLTKEVTSEEVTSEEVTSEEIKTEKFKTENIPVEAEVEYKQMEVQEEMTETIQTHTPNSEVTENKEIPAILIAEDNDELRRMFVESFNKLGEVLEAKNGMEAYEIASQTLPDWIISDFDMPGMTGLSLNKALKNDPVLSAIPVYLMVTDKERVQLSEADRDGSYTLIRKPVNIDELIKMISESITHSVSTPYTNPNLSERNRDLLKSGGDDPFILRLEAFIIRNIKDSSYTIDDLSKEMGITNSTLYLKVKALEGLTPLDFIMKTKLNYARTLISNGKSDLSEVAREAGFQNKDLFYSAYKKYFGFMPGTIIEKRDPK